MAKKKAVQKTPDAEIEPVDIQPTELDVPQPQQFPDCKILRLVQMAGYLQFFFENGVNGATDRKDEIKLLQDRLKEQRS